MSSTYRGCSSPAASRIVSSTCDRLEVVLRKPVSVSRCLNMKLAHSPLELGVLDHSHRRSHTRGSQGLPQALPHALPQPSRSRSPPRGAGPLLRAPPQSVRRFEVDRRGGLPVRGGTASAPHEEAPCEARRAAAHESWGRRPWCVPAPRTFSPAVPCCAPGLCGREETCANVR